VKEAIVVVLHFIHLFALSPWMHGQMEFFCVSIVMDPNNQALRNAVHRVANARLKAAAQNISRAANAAKNGELAQLRKELANLKRTLPAARQAAAAAETVAPEVPAAPSTVNATNTLISKIAAGNYNNRLKNPYNNLDNAAGYNASRQNNINRAISSRRITFKPLPAPPSP
jgi:hypothetical protein